MVHGSGDDHADDVARGVDNLNDHIHDDHDGGESVSDVDDFCDAIVDGHDVALTVMLMAWWCGS